MSSSLDFRDNEYFNKPQDDENEKFITKKDLIEFLKNNLVINVKLLDGWLEINLKIDGEKYPFSGMAVNLEI